jgi:hypothetical protein
MTLGFYRIISQEEPEEAIDPFYYKSEKFTTHFF